MNATITLLAITLFASVAPPQSGGDLRAPLTVALQGAGHLVAVEATLDGKGPYRLAIDTGAAGILRLRPAVAVALGLPTVGEVMAGDPSGRNSSRRPVVRVTELAIGAARFHDLDAALSEGNRDDLDGVIGLSLFSGLTVTIDYPRMELRVTRDALAAGAHVVPYTLERGIPTIAVETDGTPLTVDVDTGSPAMLTVPSAWASRLKLAGEPRVVGRGRTAANEFEIRAADLAGDLRVAGWTLTRPRVDLVDIFPVANLGSGILRDYALTFDLAQGRLALERGTEAR